MTDPAPTTRPTIGAVAAALRTLDDAVHQARHLCAALADSASALHVPDALTAALRAGDLATAQRELDALGGGEPPQPRGHAVRRLADGWPASATERHLRTAAKLLDDGLPTSAVAAGLRAQLDALEAPDDVNAIERLVLRAAEVSP